MKSPTTVCVMAAYRCENTRSNWTNYTACDLHINSCFQSGLFPSGPVFTGFFRSSPTLFIRYLHPYIQPEFCCLGLPMLLFIDLVAVATRHLSSELQEIPFRKCGLPEPPLHNPNHNRIPKQSGHFNPIFQYSLVSRITHRTASSAEHVDKELSLQGETSISHVVPILLSTSGQLPALPKINPKKVPAIPPSAPPPPPTCSSILRLPVPT